MPAVLPVSTARSLVIGRTRVHRVSSEYTVTELHDGVLVDSVPLDDDGYRAMAVRLGYGADTARMAHEHELLHTLVADWLGLDESPVLRAVAQGREHEDPDGRLWREEAAVLALQELLNAWGVDLGRLQAGGASVRPARPGEGRLS